MNLKNIYLKNKLNFSSFLSSLEVGLLSCFRKTHLLSVPLSKKMVWILFVLAPLPFFLLGAQFFYQLQSLEGLEKRWSFLHQKAKTLNLSQKKESLLLASLKYPDPHYIDQQLETLTFLLPEIKKLEAMQSDLLKTEGIKNRLQFLKKGNCLHFTEEAIRTNTLFRETEEKQQRPVELNEEDLKKVLCLIEGITIWPYGPKENRPQLIIRDFRLSKKEISPQEKSFIVSMQLIKREYLRS